MDLVKYAKSVPGASAEVLSHMKRKHEEAMSEALRVAEKEVAEAKAKMSQTRDDKKEGAKRKYKSASELVKQQRDKAATLVKDLRQKEQGYSSAIEACGFDASMATVLTKKWTDAVSATKEQEKKVDRAEAALRALKADLERDLSAAAQDYQNEYETAFPAFSLSSEVHTHTTYLYLSGHKHPLS